MLVNVHDAKSRLSKLIVAAQAGDDVVIARNGKPAVRLVPVKPDAFRFDTLEFFFAMAERAVITENAA